MEAVDTAAIVTAALHNDTIAAEDNPFEDLTDDGTDALPSKRLLLLYARFCEHDYAFARAQLLQRPKKAIARPLQTLPQLLPKPSLPSSAVQLAAQYSEVTADTSLYPRALWWKTCTLLKLASTALGPTFSSRSETLCGAQ